VRVWPLDADAAGRLPLRGVLTALAADEVNEVLVEAGPSLAGALLQAGLVDELLIYQAPHLMGDGGRPLLALPGLERMDQRRPLRLQDLRRFGDDLRLTFVPLKTAEG
jgi:diaminohydroxyphosphoribosylaminopyrimidine deaminase/5-amino-6-(5-phosphoribosylamino)uracil reductase